MHTLTPTLAISLVDHLLNNLGWYVGGAIVVIGLLVFGLGDLRRLSFKRAWAISTVCLRESVRRRVLWITPLAILGTIIVSQLQQTSDEQDAIRQTIKFCLFASGLVVTITAIILACTNLPREIDSRVIYTIVTKPTTRLEIVLGKVIGFARVSGAILLIMGLFTFGYLELRSWRLEGFLRDRLAAEPADSRTRAVLAHYADVGLLNTKSVAEPLELQIYGRPPKEGEPHWIAGGLGQTYLVNFEFTARQREAIAKAIDEDRPVLMIHTMRYRRHDPTEEELQQLGQMGAIDEQSDKGRLGPSLATAPAFRPVPQINVAFFDREDRRLDLRDLPEGSNINLPTTAEDADASVFTPLSIKTVQQLSDSTRFTISVAPVTPSIEYGIGDLPTVLSILDSNGQPGELIKPVPDKSGQPSRPLVRSSQGRYGMQIVTRKAGLSTLGVFRFDNAAVRSGGDNVLFELRAGIEHSDVDRDSRDWAANFDVVNRTTGQTYSQQVPLPETERTNYVKVPRSAVEGGKFDVIVGGALPGQWLGVKDNSVLLITANRSFAFNLFKSLLILWMLSILVVSIAIFTSTFLSWPIAIVLTLLMLLGRWSVSEMGGIGSELGSGVTVGLGLDPGATKVVRTSVYALTKALDVTARVLPDISRFAATEDLQRGISISGSTIRDALVVLAGYGITMIALSYLFLKFKEVAP